MDMERSLGDRINPPPTDVMEHELEIAGKYGDNPPPPLSERDRLACPLKQGFSKSGYNHYITYRADLLLSLGHPATMFVLGRPWVWLWDYSAREQRGEGSMLQGVRRMTLQGASGLAMACCRRRCCATPREDL
ncbi:uncharacterized protein PG986_001696 [Apiospora aurea]|uniref:Uncharacterized protein n=1 Tax=Apiospora aurea TaxID=335848 RepID=A0ABR1QXP0_9PEZI